MFKKLGKAVFRSFAHKLKKGNLYINIQVYNIHLPLSFMRSCKLIFNLLNLYLAGGGEIPMSPTKRRFDSISYNSGFAGLDKRKLLDPEISYTPLIHRRSFDSIGK